MCFCKIKIYNWINKKYPIRFDSNGRRAMKQKIYNILINKLVDINGNVNSI